jgi:hypothetical protein
VIRGGDHWPYPQYPSKPPPGPPGVISAFGPVPAPRVEKDARVYGGQVDFHVQPLQKVDGDAAGRPVLKTWGGAIKAAGSPA